MKNCQFGALCLHFSNDIPKRAFRDFLALYEVIDLTVFLELEFQPNILNPARLLLLCSRALANLAVHCWSTLGVRYYLHYYSLLGLHSTASDDTDWSSKG